MRMSPQKGRLMGLLLITRFTFQEVIRRRLFLTVLLLSLLMLGGFAFLFDYVVSHSRVPFGVDPQVYSAAMGVFAIVPIMWLVYLLSSFMTIVMAAGMVSGEVEAGTFVVTVPKPLRRYEIIVGKWLCYAIILGSYTALLFFGFASIIYWRTGYWPEETLSAISMLELGMLVLLGLMTLSSALVPTTVNGAIALVLFISVQIVNIMSFMVQILAPDKVQAFQNLSLVMNLIMPADALWHGTSYYLTPTTALNILQQVNVNSPFVGTQPAPLALVIWAILYSIVLPFGAVWFFQRRDL